jgi:hypothetical protein
LVRPVEADAPNVVWAIDFQFDSTTDGKAIKIASTRNGVQTGGRTAEGIADE